MGRLLLLSNSTNYEESYFEYAKGTIKEFIGSSVNRILFIPYAAVTISYDEYTEKVGEALVDVGCDIQGIHTFENPVEAVENAEAIAVGGGNSFELLKQLYDNNIVEIIREKVKKGTPYIGWSAGSNMSCPTLMTTNDMPISQPPTFEALNLIPFQINPHYTEHTLPNHGGESRMDRLNEYIEVNRDVKVIGLQEGCILWKEGNSIRLIGDKPAKIFQYGKKISKVWESSDLQFLLS
ncbi:MAG: dipeptidase PepE [Cyclobacteriaceae bacterium]|nr:dipeptidase PepE [Cyclobacteriaceae bacterium]